MSESDYGGAQQQEIAEAMRGRTVVSVERGEYGAPLVVLRLDDGTAVEFSASAAMDEGHLYVSIQAATPEDEG